jgi:ribonuclease HII
MKKYFDIENIEAGLDECERGVLFGRIYGAAVIYPKDGINHEMEKIINDSKKLSAKKRDLLYDFIINNVEDYSISWVDGNRFKDYLYKEKNIPYTCIIKEDSKYLSIVCASILAKVAHDRYIKDLIKNREDILKYDLENNMGYGNKKHIQAISEYGYSEFHRKSYKKFK